jgi:cytochrome c oxidase subunit 2
MQNRKSCAGSAAPAVLMSLLLLILVGSTVWAFVSKHWWFPTAITQLGHDIDQQFHFTLIITGIVFILAQLGLAWAVFRFRDRGERAHYIEGNTTMEILWTLATLVMFVGLGLMAERAWAQVHFRDAAPGALQVEVIAEKFAWNFRYPGPDGQFGRTSPTLMSDSSGNPAGLDPSDPAGKDDVVAPILTVPVNREVELLLHTKDVTHSFYIRELRLKQDLVPGMIIRIHFTPTQIGSYELACAELCGLAHYRMRSELHVVSQADYESWLRQQAAQ